MKPIKPLFLSLLLLTACGTNTPPAAKSEVSLQKQEEPAFRGMGLRIRKRNAISIRLRLNLLSFSKKDKLPAHLWAGYIKIEWKEENLNDAVPLR